MKPRKPTVLKVAAFCFLALFRVTPSFAETVDKIIAKVGGEAITQSDLNQALQARKISLIQQFGEKEGKERFTKFQRNAIEEMVLQKILDFEVAREKIQITSGELESEYRQRLRQAGGSEADFVGKLAEYGLSLAEYKKNLQREMERQRFIDKKIMPGITVSDYDVQREYAKRSSQFVSYGKLRFLEAFLLPQSFSGNEEMTRAVNQIRAAMVSGNAAALIRKLSSGAYRDKGGDSGLVDAESLRPELRDVLASLRVGEVSRPIPVDNGALLVKLVGQADPRPLPLGVVSGAIRNHLADRLVQEELKKYLLAVKDQTYVEVPR